jgi:hypothetical protein
MFEIRSLEMSDDLATKIRQLLASREVLKAWRLLYDNGFNFLEAREIVARAMSTRKGSFQQLMDWQPGKSDDEQRIIEERFLKMVDFYRDNPSEDEQNPA